MLIFKRKGHMGKLRFLIVLQETTRRPPKKVRQQVRFFALYAVDTCPQTDRACVRLLQMNQ